VPGVIGHLLERVADLPDDPACRVHQDVHRTEGGEEVADGGLIGKVSRAQRCPVQGHRLLVDPVDARPVGRERVRDRAADPVGGASDHRGLACQRHP